MMSVNLSALQFRQKDILAEIASASTRAGLRPGALQLEITETVLLQDDGQTMQNLKDLRRMGFQIAIDDFGVGYSSLSYLKRFDIQTLKLDPSFLSDLHNPRTEALARGIIQLGHSLGMKVVAEGIEDEDQLRFMRNAGCDDGQGYLLGMPMDEKQVVALLAEGSRMLPDYPLDENGLPEVGNDPASSPVRLDDLSRLKRTGAEQAWGL